MVRHVYERARQATCVGRLVIATDDERIFTAARRFGAEVRMTRPDHVSGTDRVAEVAAEEDAGVIVNIQGDEPLIEPGAIDAAVRGLLENPGTTMSTLKRKIADPHEAADPNVVKVVTDHRGRAVYFSRSPVPYARHGHAVRYKHIGLYVYSRDFLLSYSSLPIGPLERAEQLEQLRAIENGHAIQVVETEYESLGVDTPEDLQRVSFMFESGLVAGI